MARVHPRRSKGGISFPALLGVFALSGATGLMYEVVWVRSLGLVLGTSAYAVSVVLACFMGGLAFGAFVFGRRAGTLANPVRLYAYVEIGIGIYALVFPMLIAGGNQLYAVLGRMFDPPFAVLLMLRIGIAGALLLVPTVLMGGTLPLLAQAVVRSDRDWMGRIGALYAGNTLGAVVGCLLAGYAALPVLGVRITTGIAAAMNLCIGLGVLRFCGDEDAPALSSEASSTEASSTEARRHGLLILLGLVGAASLAYEVLWTRLLTPAFHATTYSFTTMLAAFLVGLGLGSAIVGWIGDRVRHRALYLLAWVEVGVGISALLASGLLWTRFAVGPWTPGEDWAGLELTKGLWALALMMGPALLMGAAFPLGVRALGTGIPGRAAGTVYAANTAGAVVGSLVAGFLLIPMLGVRSGLLAVAGVNLFAGLGLLWMAGGRIWRFPVAAGGFAIALVVYGLQTVPSPETIPGRLLYDREGISGRASVVRTGLGARVLLLNGKKLGGTDVADTERTFAHLPLLLSPDADSMAVIGLGIGATLSAALAHPVRHIDCLEIAREVVDAARFFKDVHRRALSDPRVAMRVEDGRNFLLRAPGRYGLILSDIVHPENADAGNLYTLEHFHLCRSRLTPNGRMAQWIPLSQMAEAEVRSVILGFTRAFPYVTAWFGDLYAPSPTLLLLGSTAPQTIRMADLRARFTEEISADLPAASDDVGVMGLFIADRAVLADYAAGAQVNTDDNLYLASSTPRHTWRESENALANFTALARLRWRSTPPTQDLTDADRERLKRARAVRDEVVRGQVLRARGRLEEAEKIYARAAGSDSDDRILGRAALDLADAYRARGDAAGALRAYRRASILMPDDAWSPNGLSAIFLRLGQVDSARVAAERAIELDSNWPDGYCSLGNARLKKGDLAGARMAYEAALAQTRDYAPALRNLSGVYLMEREYDAAADVLKRLVAVVPNDLARRYELAVAYAMGGHHAHARETLERLLAMASNPTEVTRAEQLLQQLETGR